MSDAGVYKVKFQNEQGEDETQGKVQIKPVSKISFLLIFLKVRTHLDSYLSFYFSLQLVQKYLYD